MSTPPILLYDLASVMPQWPWSGNTLKTRITLNYKGIPHTTTWLEIPDIELVSTRLGAAPTGQKLDGSPAYTVPFIQHFSSSEPDTTIAVVSESARIAKYLDGAFEDTPKLFPDGTDAVQLAFIAAFDRALLSMWQFAVPAIRLRPRSWESFKESREGGFGKKMEDIEPKGENHLIEWHKFRDDLGTLDTWLKQKGDDTPWVMGNTMTFSDIVVGAFFVWFRRVRPDKWDDVKSWHGGRWAGFAEKVEPYTQVHGSPPA